MMNDFDHLSLNADRRYFDPPCLTREKFWKKEYNPDYIREHSSTSADEENR